MRTLIRSLGELCITAGAVLLLFVAYELWGTGAYTQAEQRKLDGELTRTWAAPQRKPSGAVTAERVQLGHGLALIRIPRLGKGFHYVIIEGVSVADLRKGPGHYPGTAMPGEIGNFVVSGHRTTYLAPFNRIGELQAGDKILIDTRTRQYTYKITGKTVVSPSDVSVVAPVPEHPTKDPTDRLITLTTCHPKYSAAQRLIVFGRMVGSIPRVNGASS
ncbi:class E sortase [Actinoallomurus purpureus]|uniref:class E sortase n=1 Tax=Actinoallomurus purpureus TaxID=478114 RepID=UPI0020923C5F|nr:class E sortase [Actinoallomurus purpureus]MCO6007380.1 class E sortase [Actinoallomurus purpureus]